MASGWNAADVPDQSGRTVMVTGATSGLGLVTARELARAGAHVVLAVRDAAKGARVAASLRGSSEVRPLDLADLTSVRKLAQDWTDPLDVLVNNAGVMMVPKSRTKDGFETQIGTNHLGHFALTNLLLPWITDRVVTLSSGAHSMGSIDLGDLNWERRRYRRNGAYAQSKLANLLFTLELQRRLVASGSKVLSLAAHPGYAATNLQGRSGIPVADFAMRLGNRIIAQSETQGALPILYAVTQDLPPASYVGPDGPWETRGHPTLVGRSAPASDPDLARRLWDLSQELTGVGFPVLPPDVVLPGDVAQERDIGRRRD